MSARPAWVREAQERSAAQGLSLNGATALQSWPGVPESLHHDPVAGRWAVRHNVDGWTEIGRCAAYPWLLRHGWPLSAEQWAK